MRWAWVSVILAIGPLLAPRSVNGDELGSLMRSQLSTLLRDEYEITHRSLQRELSLSTQRMHLLETQQNDAVKRAQAAGVEDRKGIEAMKQLDQLIQARYVDKKGDFQPGMEIAGKDAQNINDIFSAHLSMTPLSGRISAGYARRTLAWGRDRLDDIAGQHESPSESNNPELEIVAKQLREEQAKVDKVGRLAESLKITLDPNAPVLTEPAVQTDATVSAINELVAPASAATVAKAPQAAPVKRAPASKKHKRRVSNDD